jgi:hypothetical protein
MLAQAIHKYERSKYVFIREKRHQTSMYNKWRLTNARCAFLFKPAENTLVTELSNIEFDTCLLPSCGGGCLQAK